MLTCIIVGLLSGSDVELHRGEGVVTVDADGGEISDLRLPFERGADLRRRRFQASYGQGSRCLER